MKRRPLRIATASLAAVVLGSAMVGGVAARHLDRSDVFDLVRAAVATARFHSLGQADRAGYAQPPAPAPLHECISNGAQGAMGFHFIKGSLLDTTLEPTRPEALVYAPDRNGNLHLGALEYVVFQDAWNAAHPGTMPELFGQMFMPVNAAPGHNGNTVFDIPPFYMLHVWSWNSNPSGLFNPWNPSVSCAGASASAGSSTATLASTKTIAAAAGLKLACDIKPRTV
jgi:hypothetical protein